MTGSSVIKKLASIALVVLLVTGCLPGKRLANEYVDDLPRFPLLLLAPDFIYKNNLKDYEIKNRKEMTEAEMDSLLFYRSLYLQYIEDDKFMGLFMGQFDSVLSGFGYRTYREDSIEEFTRIPQEAYVLNLAQVLMEEYVYQYEASALVVDQVLTVDSIDLNALGISMWFELNPVNTDEVSPVVLFANDQVVDDMDGRFVTSFFQDDVLFEYNIDSLQLSRIYQSAGILGRKYASYFIDYMMNRYILGKTPDDASLPYYYHYDIYDHSIYPVDERFRFIEMQPE